VPIEGTIVGVLHHQVQIPFVFEILNVSDDIRMLEHFQHVGFIQRLHTLGLAHTIGVNDLHDHVLAVRLVFE